MLNRSKLAAFLLASLVVAPVLAGGRPACCIKAQAPAKGCCPAAAQASPPKGCCKAPVAPKPETKLKDAAPDAMLLAPFDVGSPAQPSIVIPEVVGVRLARCAHRAE